MNCSTDSKNLSFLESREGKLYSRPKIIYLYYLCIFISITYDYIWLYIENKEEIEVEEGRATPPPEDPPVGNCFYFDICGAEPNSPIT
jgi:hypothetical protein